MGTESYGRSAPGNRLLTGGHADAGSAETQCSSSCRLDQTGAFLRPCKTLTDLYAETAGQMSQTSDTSWTTSYNTESLPDQIRESMRHDVLTSIQRALDGHAVLPWTGAPHRILRIALAECVHDIEHHDRGELLRRFLRPGAEPRKLA